MKKILERKRCHGILRTESGQYDTGMDMQPKVPKEKQLVNNQMFQILDQILEKYMKTHFTRKHYFIAEI